MSLLEVRKKFRDLSGRFELVNKDGSSNGADFYINAGQRYLNRKGTTQKSYASSFKFIQIDNYAASFPFCRAIKEVWAATTTAKWQLEKKDLADMIAGYFTTLPSDIDSGTAAYYSPAVTRTSPETYKTDLASFEAYIGYVDIMSAEHFAYNTILIAPPTEEKLLIEVKGLFYDDQLTSDTDKSIWTEVHPDILVMAAIRMLEVYNRNTQGVNDWDSAIRESMHGIELDLVEEEIAEVTQIED